MCFVCTLAVRATVAERSLLSFPTPRSSDLIRLCNIHRPLSTLPWRGRGCAHAGCARHDWLHIARLGSGPVRYGVALPRVPSGASSTAWYEHLRFRTELSPHLLCGIFGGFHQFMDTENQCDRSAVSRLPH